jgi:radical SAM protein with 4Fe4S-binding SPASM domain
MCRLPLPDVGNRDEMMSSFEQKLSSLSPAGAYRECALCGYKANAMCDGGCRARRALRFRTGNA